MRRLVLITLLTSAGWFLPSAAPCRANGEKHQVDADFPGGNIIVDKIDGDNVHLHQDLRDTAGDWFYWHFRVRGAQGRSLTFHFTRGNPIGVRGPAVSTDGGKSWQWLGAQAVRGPTFHYAFPADAREVRFCFAFPYLEHNLREFLRKFEKDPHLKVETLCKTRKGRDVELLLLGRLDGKCIHRVALTCRHHCCEMMASYVLEGLVEEILADTADGKWLREHVEFFIVPMVDKDGVEDGDQGKNRKPHDHNRDYEGESIYASVKAIREQVPKWSAGKLRFALDMHCPSIRGGGNETVFLVGVPDEKIWTEVGRYSKLLESVQTGPLVFQSKDNLPFGQGWNTQANYGTKKPFAQWAAGLPGVRVATTLEVAYANAGGKAVTDQSARALGHDLARALRKYLEPAPGAPAFQAPKGWRPVEDRGVMLARFEVGEGKHMASATVMTLLGEGGGLVANVNRWRAQIGLDALDEQAVARAVRPIKVDGLPGHGVDLTGPQVDGKASQRILAVVVKEGDRVWFFKLMGPADLVAEEKQAFEQFVESVRFDGPGKERGPSPGDK
jgi:hypothetical protein